MSREEDLEDALRFSEDAVRELRAKVTTLEAGLADWKAAYNKLHDQKNKAEKDAYEFQRIVRELNAKRAVAIETADLSLVEDQDWHDAGLYPVGDVSGWVAWSNTDSDGEPTFMGFFATEEEAQYFISHVEASDCQALEALICGGQIVSSNNYGIVGHKALNLRIEEVLAKAVDKWKNREFPCCGGNDEHPKEHCMDCPDGLSGPWVAGSVTRDEVTQLREQVATLMKARADDTRSFSEIYNQDNATLAERCRELNAELDDMRTAKSGAFTERNRLVALLARAVLTSGGKAGRRKHEPDNDQNWDAEWWTLVSIDLPTGQVSWHFHDSDAHLVADLPVYEGSWDGHSTEEKYQRVASCAQLAATPDLSAIESVTAYLREVARNYEANPTWGRGAWFYRDAADRVDAALTRASQDKGVGDFNFDCAHTQVQQYVSGHKVVCQQCADCRAKRGQFSGGTWAEWSHQYNPLTHGNAPFEDALRALTRASQDKGDKGTRCPPGGCNADVANVCTRCGETPK